MSHPEEPTRDQLARLEARLSAIEDRLEMRAPTASRARRVPPAPPRAAAPAPPDAARTTTPPTPAGGWSISVTGIMASGAGVAFVLAAVYFLKLVYDFGWLTPERQVGLALLSGVGLIVGGLGLANQDRAYAAYLPAFGIVIVYLTIYAADLYYAMIGPGMVVAGVGATTLAAIWLQRHFGSGIYALFAVIGTYMFPLLLPSRSAAAIDLIVYFAAWGLLFSWLALQAGERTVYVLALWFSLLGFDIAWRLSAASDAWVQAASYQFFQFLLFAITAAIFSMRHRTPLSRLDAFTHGAALFVFYGLEYALLKEHAAAVAPFAALGSVLVVVLLLVWARAKMGDAGRGGAGALVVSTYAAVVTTHVLLIELLPERYFAWGVLLLPILAMALKPLAQVQPETLTPLRLVGGVLFAVGLMQLAVANGSQADIAFPVGALFVYAAFLYVGALRARRAQGRHPRPPMLLYAGHVALMVAIVKALTSALAVSSAWAVLAVALLVIALRAGDRVVGRSSLLIFFASSLKVMLYDLEGSPTLVRVAILVVVGCSLYLGGWLYQRMPEHEADARP